MTAAWRTPEAFIHGAHHDVVIVPGRIAAWLHRRLDLDRLRIQIRGGDAELDAVLVALTLAAHEQGTVVNDSRSSEGSPELGESSEWLGCNAVARQLGITPNGVRQAIYSKRLPARQIDGRWQISTTDLNTYTTDKE